jgi:ketosteroid isomerase-like protein
MKSINFLKSLLLFILIVAFISCENKKEETKTVKQFSNLEEVLKETNQKIEKAIFESDYETLLKFYTDDVVFMPNFHSVLRGKSAVRESYEEQQKAKVKIHSFNARIDKIWSHGNEIFEYGTFGFAVSSRETKHPYAFTGAYFMIWEKQKDATYLIKYLISNYDFDPCDMLHH